MRNHAQEYMVSAQYFAPRGKERLMFLGEQISHRHLFFNDRLIGIVHFDPAKAIKTTIVRPIPSGALGETDVYGAQQHVPLMKLEFDL